MTRGTVEALAGAERRTCPMPDHPRRFPRPWTVEETYICFTVVDASGRIAANIDVEENGTGRGWAM